MEVWIDKTAGRHYHKATCSMVQDPRLPYYEPVEIADKIANKHMTAFIDGKVYLPCPSDFYWERR